MLEQSRFDKKTNIGNPVTCVTFTGAGAGAGAGAGDQYKPVWVLLPGKFLK
jgi:hypothetical protein